ncbi:hypothetical protein AVEN_113198-1 [Araneus ventricosus]|uniref:BTB domain-containing protein n=1 Tax=Araneus ventricosus TaxID=182803 RepID=A0A4Y2M9B3_ARAVE|nr:hypothetical protein AVEN_113198-1 [Araneus ventricosus]
MSSATSQSSSVASVSYNFVLKWSLKGKKLKDLRQESSNLSVIRSDMYQFKSAKDLGFYLEIAKSSYAYNINIKGSKTWSFELVYAFLVSKERAFQLKASPQLSFLSSFYDLIYGVMVYSRFLPDEEDVTVHCVVIADPVHQAPSTKEDDLSLKEGQNIVDIEGRPMFALPESYTNKMVIDFIRRGDVPNLDIDKAIQIIRETKEHKCEVLKILCVEYLMGNITTKSIRQISRAAIDIGLPVLERSCMEKIADGSIQTNDQTDENRLGLSLVGQCYSIYHVVRLSPKRFSSDDDDDDKMMSTLNTKSYCG